MAPTLTELIDRAPWREAVTYRNTWPHEYVLSNKDDQRDLIEAVCARFRAGEGVCCRFFPYAQRLSVYRRLQILVDDRLRRNRSGRGCRLCIEPGAALSGS